MPTADHPVITAVVLTWNEAENIAAAVTSLAGAVDRILLIDACSTDATVHVAAAAAESVALPLRTVRRPWTDDFSAQRNQAFSEVTDGWLLFVDADERLREGHAALLRQAVRGAHDDPAHRDKVLSPRVVDVAGGGVYDRTRRVLRADTRLRFRGRIHEQPFHPDGSAPTATELDVELIHHGYLPDVIAARSKRTRDGALIARCRREEPANPVWAFYAGREILAGQVTDPEAIARAYEDLREALDRYTEASLTDYERQREDEAYALLAELALRSGARSRIDACLALLRRSGRTGEAAYYGALVDSGVLLARLSALIDGLDQAAEAAGPVRTRLAGRHAELRALIALACGRYDEVPEAYRHAVRCGAGGEVRQALADLRGVLADVSGAGLT
ncbi:glycosyltransferase [Streptomyces sp. NPDC057616]|uniref:glycosyltransferase n=1 Tax=Streptomyces sp. NPDC057616 TaxID=3346183 RepID=UPI0036A1555D